MHALLGVGVAGLAFGAGTDAALNDIVARIDYGFYTADPRMIDAARADLARLQSSSDSHAYYTAYAAFRLSRLDAAPSRRAARELIDVCLHASRESAATGNWAVEAEILRAACSLQGLAQEPVLSRGHELRLREALQTLRAIDPSHPRMLLVAAWQLRANPDADDDLARRRALLERALEEFDLRDAESGTPDWGRAEVLANLGEVYLELGELRDARDHIEQALIETPDYRFALELKNALSLRR